MTLTLIGALIVAAAAPASAAAPPATTTGSAAVAQVTTGTVSPTVTVTGPLAGLVGPLVSSTLGLIWSAVQLVPSGVVNPLLTSLVGPYSATTPTANGTISGTVPTPCNSPTCYSAGATNINAGILGLNTGTVQGWVQYDTSGAKPKIQSTSIISNQSLTLPALSNLSLLALGQINASTNCTESGTSAASASVTTSKILGGADAGGVDIQNTLGSLSVRFKNGSFQPLTALGAGGVNLSAAGVSATASAGAGGYLKVTLHLGLSDLLNMLGLGALAVTVASATVDLSLSVGSVALVTSPTTVGQAWGLEVGVDLAADIVVNLVGATAELSMPTGLTATTFGNIADLRLGYASCTAGSTIPTPAASWIPPELS